MNKNTNTEAKIDNLTDTCVAQINEQAIKEKDAWIEAGRIIKEYIENSGETQDAALKLLADHEECLVRISQLRNYKEAYEVYESLNFEVGTSKLTMTHYVAVQSSKLTFHKKKELLKKASDEDLSVAALKAEVQNALGKVADPKPDPMPDITPDADPVSSDEDEVAVGNEPDTPKAPSKKTKPTPKPETHENKAAKFHGRLTEILGDASSLNKDGVFGEISDVLHDEIRETLELILNLVSDDGAEEGAMHDVQKVA